MERPAQRVITALRSWSVVSSQLGTTSSAPVVVEVQDIVGTVVVDNLSTCRKFDGQHPEVAICFVNSAHHSSRGTAL